MEFIGELEQEINSSVFGSSGICNIRGVKNRMGVKNRQMRETSKSENIGTSELKKMVNRLYRSNPIKKCNYYQPEGSTLAYNLDAHFLEDDYLTIKDDIDKSDSLDIIESIFGKDYVNLIDSESPAIHRRDYIDLQKTMLKQSQTSTTIMPNFTNAFTPRSKGQGPRKNISKLRNNQEKDFYGIERNLLTKDTGKIHYVYSARCTHTIYLTDLD